MAAPLSLVFNNTPKFDRDFGEYLLAAYDNPVEYGIHQMFDDWWQFAPQKVKDEYLADFRNIQEQREFIEGEHSDETLDMETLKQFKEGTLGHYYYHHMINNGLDTDVVREVKRLHLENKEAGRCEGMPHEMHLSLMRFYETHDIMHALTGCEPTEEGEVAVIGFYLAQFRFPYFAMWVAVMVGRMAFLDPKVIQPTMDALCKGWKMGRKTKNVQFVRWEERFGDNLEDIRKEFGIETPELVYGDDTIMANQTPKFDRDFAQLLFKAFDNPKEYGVHQMFDDWWRYADEGVKEEYVSDFETVPAQQKFFEQQYFPPKIDAESLKSYPSGSLGKTYSDFLEGNSLDLAILDIYKETNEKKIKDGTLVGIPDEMKYAVVRMIQTHDIMHTLTGYEATDEGEVGVIGFVLAQYRMPYPAMWVAVLMARMTFLDPRITTELMDTLFAGWERGRKTENLQFVPWEERLGDQVSDLREEFGIAV